MLSTVPQEAGLVSAVIRQARHQLLLRQQPWTPLEPLAVAWRDSLYGPRGQAHHLSTFLDAFQRLAGGPSAIWALSRSTGPSQWGSMGYGLMTSPHALAALQRVVQWQALIPLGLRCDLQPCLVPAGSSRQMLPGWQMQSQAPAEGEGLGYWLFVLGCRVTLLESVGVHPSTVTQLMLPCEAEPEVLSVLSAAGLSVVFRTRAYEELYAHDSLVRPNPHSSPDVHRAMCQTAWWPSLATSEAFAPPLAQDQAADLVGLPGLSARLHHTLRQTVHAELDRGLVPTLESIAPRLRLAVGQRGTSVRQLQRHLAAAQLSFREVVAEVRRERALLQLRESRKPLAEIAAEAGYAELSSFHRAVRRWTGTTPLALRSCT
jgi:AraC-like DNA-binding protein